MTWDKRLFDIFFALILLPLILPLILCIGIVVLLVDGRPVFFGSERMRTPERAFALWKFRTMTSAQSDTGVSGGYKNARITRTGRLLRRARADELPQILNILRGDMSFVGPRPPLREYVESHRELYQRVLRSRPGVTGLATLHIHRFEQRVLSDCNSAAETDQVYRRRCIPRKASIDLIYQRNRNLCFDVVLIAQTMKRLVTR